MQLYPEHIRPMPTGPGWQTWSLWELRNLLGVWLLSPENPDRVTPQLAAQINGAITHAFSRPAQPLQATDPASKLALLGQLDAYLPSAATWSKATVAQLRHSIDPHPQSPEQAALLAGLQAGKLATIAGLVGLAGYIWHTLNR